MRLCSFLVLISLFSTSACASLVNPYVDTPGMASSYEGAIEGAHSTQNALAQNLREHQQFEFVTGGTLIVLGIAATALGAYDASRDTIIGVGIGAATVGSARAFVPFAERKRVYLRGSAAIDCALTVTSISEPAPTSDASGPAALGLSATALANRTAELTERLSEIQAAFIRSGPVGILGAAQTERLSSASTDARRAILDANEAFDAAGAQAATRLERATSAIVQAVNAQLAAASSDPDASVRAMQGELASYVARAREAALEAERKLEELKEEAEESESEASVLKSVAVAAGSNLPAGEATKLAGTAQQLEAAAEDARTLANFLDPQIRAILERLSVSAQCLGGLLPAAS